MALTIVCLILCAQLALAQPDRIYGPMDPPPRGIMTTFTGSGPNDGQVGIPGGKTCTFQNCDLSATTTVYFSILNNEVKASMDGCSYSGSEVMTYQAGQSNLNGGVAIWQGSTYIPLWNNVSSYIIYGRNIRFIMTVTDGSGTPVPLVSAASLGLPPNCGAVAPITDPDQVLRVRMEIQTYYGSWQPILTYYNDEAQHTPSGNQVCTSIDWGFYWVNSPPQLTIKMPLAVDEGSSATITSTHLQAIDVESGPSQVYFVSDPDDETVLPEHGVLKRAGIVVPHGGSFSVADVNNNLITYEHDGSESTDDGFVFKVKDGDGAYASDAGFELFQFNINISPVNDPPVAHPDAISWPMNLSFVDTLTGTDPDSSPLEYVISTNGKLGTATLIDDAIGNFEYVPIQDAIGNDTLYFKVSDGEYTSDSAMFIVILYNTPPVVEKDTIQTWEDTPVSGILTGTDFDYQSLVYRLVDLPSLGTVELTDSVSGDFTYTPTEDLFGEDFFSYLAYDGYDVSAVDTITIDIRPNIDVGDLIVAGKNGLILLDTLNQQQAVISSGDNFLGIRYVRPEASGDLLVMDMMNGLIRVDPVTGEQTVVSASTNFSTPPPGVSGIAMEKSGDVVVADGANGIVRVDVTTGNVTTVSSGGELTFPFGVTVDFDGNIFVSDAGTFMGGTSKILKIDPVTGDQTVISSGDSLQISLGITFDHSGDLLVLESRTLASGAYDMILRVDTASGEQTVVTTDDHLSGPTDLTVNRAGEILSVNAIDGNIVLTDPVTGNQVLYATGGYLAEGWGVYLVPEPNHAPVLVNPITDQETDEDALFEFTLAGNVFTDEDPGDVLTWMATLSDDSSLPAWLTFDPETLLFSGTPENGDVGTIEIKVTVTDRGEASASDLFLLTVNNTNDPPILVSEIADVNAQAKVVFSYIFPEGTFVDDDPGDQITYSAEALLFGGGLPTWLSFDGLMRKFTGTPAPEDVGTYNIVVTATDNSMMTTTDTFDIVVSPHSGIIDEADGLNLRIYPNPSEGVFHVDMQLSEMQNIELRVLTLTGQLIWHQKHAGQVGEMRYTVDVKGKGVYNLEIIHNKGIITKRIVVY